MKLNENSVIKNRLFQYKGGGYDGCHWEWNYFLFDSEGNFHNLVSSGRNGIKDKAEAINLINDDWGYKYKLNEAGIHEFVTECAESHVTAIATQVNRIYGEDVITMTCPCCEDKVTPDYMYPTGYHGNGGIGVVHTDYVCGDCHASNSCGTCGEYVGSYDDDENDWPDYNKLADEFEGKYTKSQIEAIHMELEESCSTCHYCLESELQKRLKA